MWTSRNCARYDRSKLRYPSDVNDEEWELMVPLIPPGKSGGGKRTVIMREVVNGLMYVLSTGCQWRAIPKDLPPKSTVYDYFDLWTYDGTLQRIHNVVRTNACDGGPIVSSRPVCFWPPFRQGLTTRKLTWAVSIPRHLKVYPADVQMISFAVVVVGHVGQRALL